MVPAQNSEENGCIRNFGRNLTEKLKPRAAQKYRYVSLTSEGADIRIVRLWPGQWDDRIRIELIVRPLVDVQQTTHEQTSYEALSYVWGHPAKKNQESTISVMPSDRSISITPNLDEALRYLRRKDTARLLWIDALSINQNDTKEKNVQVQRMASIYSMAASVIAWIGDEKGTSLAQIAFDCFRTISTHVSVDGALRELQPRTDDAAWADKDIPLPVDDSQLLAIVHLLQRPWWKRLWIWQEIQLGHDRATLMCGRQTISWESVCAAIFVLRSKVLPHLPSASSAIEYLTSSLAMEYIYSLCDITSLDLLSALHRSRLAGCTDARDRVYGVLSLVHRSGFDVDIRPDYSKTNTEANVFTQAAVSHIKNFEDLDQLLYVGEARKMHGLPSWVPNWNFQNAPCPFQYVDAGPGKASGIFIHKKTLYVKAKLIASMAEVSQSCIDGEEWGDLECTEARLRKMIAEMPGLVTDIENGDSAVLEMLCRVLCSNSLAHRVVQGAEQAPSRWPTVQECAAVIFQILNGQQFEESSGHVMYIRNRIHQYCNGRVLFRSKGGRIGLAPAKTQARDIVAVMPGCKAPVILRRACFGRYHVVGAAYLDGFMSGEAILGNLPHTVEQVIILDSANQSWAYGFRDKLTGLVSLEDPRLREHKDHQELRYRRLV